MAKENKAVTVENTRSSHLWISYGLMEQSMKVWRSEQISLTWEWQHKIICLYVLGTDGLLWIQGINSTTWEAKLGPHPVGLDLLESGPTLSPNCAHIPHIPSPGVPAPQHPFPIPPACCSLIKILPNEFVSPTYFKEYSINSWREKSMLEFGYFSFGLICSLFQTLPGELWMYRVYKIGTVCLLENEFTFFLHFYI